MESVFAVVFVKPASSGQLIPGAGFLVERHTGICSGRAAEDRAGTAIDEREILLRGFVDSLGELEVHLHRCDQAGYKDASVHRKLISQPARAKRIEHAMHTTLIVPEHINKLGISADDDYCAFDGDS